MKRGILIFMLILVTVLGLMAVFNKQIKLMFFGPKQASEQVMTDLEIINDTQDSVSVEYKNDLNKQPQVAKPNEVLTGGEGYMRVFVANKKGSYEIKYPFPRKDKPAKIALSQVIEAANKELTTTGQIFTAKGMIDDIVVIYEEIPAAS